jgi:hypothetical protein
MPSDVAQFLPANVQLDPASEYGWNELCEVEFLCDCFRFLADELGDLFSLWQFYVFSSHDPKAIPSSSSYPGDYKVLIAISDEEASESSTLLLSSSYRLVFKCYLPRDPLNSCVHPFPLGFVAGVPELPLQSFNDRRFDVFFAGNLNSSRLGFYCALRPLLRYFPRSFAKRLARRIPDRFRRCIIDRFYDRRLGKAFLLFSGGFRKGLKSLDYAQILHSSRIVLCPRGFISAETFRHFEALRAGCVVISEPLPDTYFYRDGPFVVLQDWREAPALVRSLLANPDRLQRLHHESLNWYRTHGSPEATALYMADILKENQ